MNYDFAVKIARIYTEAGLDVPEGFSFTHEGVSIADASMDSSYRFEVDPSHYGESYADYVKLIGPLEVRVFGRDDVDCSSPLSISNVDFEDTIDLFSTGGGFVIKVPVKDFISQFRITTVDPLASRTWVSGSFYLDDSPEHHGYHCKERWNGWAIPYFEFDEASRIAKLYSCKEFPISYDEARDAFIALNDDCSDVFESVVIDVGGSPKKVYGVGAGCWVWNID